MLSVRYTGNSVLVVIVKTNPVKQWLLDNVGPYMHKTSMYSYHSPKEFMPIADRFRVEYLLPDAVELHEICEIVGDGWTCYLTREQIEVDEVLLTDDYVWYVFIPDEMLALQCKLAVS